MNKIPAIILAVNSSNIFPSRSLLNLGNGTVLEHIFKRLQKSNYIDQIVLSTSTLKVDDSLVDLAATHEIKYTRVDISDVVDRLLSAYTLTQSETAVIVRGDTPLIDFNMCDKLYESHMEQEADFSYNEHLFGLPYGLGCEICNKSVLTSMQQKNLTDLFSQKPTLFIRFHKNEYRTNKYIFDVPNPDARFVIENPKDYDFIKEIHSFSKDYSSAYDYLNLLGKHPYLDKINKPDAHVQEIGMNKLFLFPEKIKYISQKEIDFSYPVSVEMSLTNDCNLSCKWCSDNKLRDGRPGSIPFDRYEKLIYDLSQNGTKGLVIEGGGEPTTYPQFADAVSLALSQQLAVGLITNGVLFNYEDLVPKMEWIRVSLDSDTPETFQKWKGHDYFYNVLDNIQKMCQIKQNCVIGIGYVVTKHNIEHLEEITNLLCEYGVNYVYLRPVIDNPELRIDSDLLYLKKYETNDFSVMIHAMKENVIMGNHNLPCVSNSLSTVISGDGAVFLCGRLNIHDWIKPIGNINNSTFHEIWTSEERKKQIELISNPEFCNKWCPECRLTKYNILFNDISQIKTRNFI